MTVLECHFILPTGQKCRCAALGNQRFCRHHAPQPLLAGPPPLPKRQQYSRLSRWRRLGQSAPWLDPAEIPIEILGILESLLGQTAEPISDLAAGRYLRALLRRLGQVPFTAPEAPAGDPAGPTANPTVPPSPEHLQPRLRPVLEPARLPSPQPRPFPLPTRIAADSGPTAENVHAALEEAFPNGRPTPGQKLDPQSMEALSSAFVRYGIVPPEMAPKGRA